MASSHCAKFSSVEKVENEADEEESAVGEVLIPESCVL
jgi:hypothetical protein